VRRPRTGVKRSTPQLFTTVGRTVGPEGAGVVTGGGASVVDGVGDGAGGESGWVSGVRSGEADCGSGLAPSRGVPSARGPPRGGAPAREFTPCTPAHPGAGAAP